MIVQIDGRHSVKQSPPLVSPTKVARELRGSASGHHVAAAGILEECSYFVALHEEGEKHSGADFVAIARDVAQHRVGAAGHFHDELTIRFDDLRRETCGPGERGIPARETRV